MNVDRNKDRYACGHWDYNDLEHDQQLRGACPGCPYAQQQGHGLFPSSRRSERLAPPFSHADPSPRLGYHTREGRYTCDHTKILEVPATYQDSLIEGQHLGGIEMRGRCPDCSGRGTAQYNDDCTYAFGQDYAAGMSGTRSQRGSNSPGENEPILEDAIRSGRHPHRHAESLSPDSPLYAEEVIHSPRRSPRFRERDRDRKRGSASPPREQGRRRRRRRDDDPEMPSPPRRVGAAVLAEISREYQIGVERKRKQDKKRREQGR